jgi:DMSO/TMAO reductase YedYZ molybdopterin-dependent catalytic subunit
MKNTLILTFLLILLASCSPVENMNPGEASTLVTSQKSPCELPPITIPTLPAEIPGYAQLDETTGLHVTGRVPEIDFSAYRLSVTGLVENPVSFTYEELRCMPKVTAEPLLVCRGLFEDSASWSGVLMDEILQEAQPLEEAQWVSLISADGYQVDISLSVAMDGESFLAYEWEGETLPMLHGFPLRAVIPTREGLYWAKWLVELEVK